MLWKLVTISEQHHYTVADLGGLRGGYSPPPFLKSQEVQKNECIDIKTK